jgi:glycosyltransferase involved in cell wall biosynthesis
MKILVFNWQDIKNPQAGGAEVHLHEVFSRIAGLGHQVTLFCSSFPGAPERELLNGIEIIRRGGRSLFNYHVPLAYRSIFRRAGFDVVIDDMNKIPFFTPLFVREPLVGITHHLFGRSIFREINFLAASYVYMMENLAVWLYRRRRVPFIVGSPSTFRELRARRFREPDVTLVNYAVDHAVHRRTGVPRSPTPLIGYFGRLKKYKSIDHLLQALPLVLSRHPGLRTLIVGEGDDRPRLEALARELGVDRNVEFTGFVDEQRKVELLQQMWAKVTTSSKEGWGLTVLEANACGTPVIASDVPGLRDAVKKDETGILYPYGNVDELAARIVQIISDEPLRMRLAANALSWAGEFSWDVAARRTLEVIERVGFAAHGSER